jgi:hypothetical protein
VIDLASHIENIARYLLGEPNRHHSTRQQLRFGTNGSLAVEIAGPKLGTWYDHEHQVGGSAWDLVRIKAGIADADISGWLERELGIRQGNGYAGSSDGPKIVASYDYHDEAGSLLFQVCRLHPKTFRQRRPDGKGGWEWKTQGTRMVPYRLPDLCFARAGANGKPWRVYIVEGEKDADRLAAWGLTATTNPAGAGKWRDEFSKYFAGADAVVLADNDDAGRKHAEAVAKSLVAKAERVRVLNLRGVPEKGDFSDWADDGGTQSDFETLVDDTTELFVAKPADQEDPEIKLFDAADILGEVIPPREWLLGTTFCKQFTSSLIGTGGVGKTAVRIVQALAVATGRNISGEYVHKRAKVLFLCFEDGIAELKRRVQAAMIHHKVTDEQVRGWLLFATIAGHRLFEAGPRGDRVPGTLGSWLRARIDTRHPELIILDPFIKTHGLEENDNSGIDAVCTLLSQISIEHNIAVDYLHHIRKGAAEPGNADAGRGASAAKDAARLARTSTPMSKEDGELFGVSEQDRVALVRLDDGKVNLAPKSPDAMWFRLVGVSLGNGTLEYPNGDNVQTAERWYPPMVADVVTVDVGNCILDRIDEGPEPGRKYSPAFQSKDRCVIPAIVEICPELTEAQAKHLIATWLKNDVLRAQDYHDTKDRKQRKGLFVGTRPGTGWDAPTAKPTLVKGVPADVENRILDEIDCGLPPGCDGDVHYYDEASAWAVVRKHAPHLSEAQSREFIKSRIESHVFIVIEYRHFGSDHLTKGLRVDPTMRPS